MSRTGSKLRSESEIFVVFYCVRMHSKLFILAASMGKICVSFKVLTNFLVLMRLPQAAELMLKDERKPETLEDIGVKILNALIKFGKTELTRAQVQLLQKAHPEKVAHFEFE